MPPDLTSKCWFRRMEAQFRIRVGTDLADYVGWITASPGFRIGCCGFIGPHKQLQLSPKLPGEDVAKILRESLIRMGTLAQDSRTQWLRFARFRASSWNISCAFEEASSRFTITFPKELRELGIPALDGQEVCVFGMSNTLEVWSAEKWLEHVQQTSKEIRKVMDASVEQLQEREL